MKNKTKKNGQGSAANGLTAPPNGEERFLNRISELAAIFRKEKPKETLPDWVWACFGGILKQIFPKHFPKLWDKSGPSFIYGFVLGSLPRLEEILSLPNSENTALGIKSAFAVIPKENEKELLRLLSGNLRKGFSKIISSEDTLLDFWESPKKFREAFAKGLLAGTMLEEDLGAYVERASGTTLTLNLAMWISWTEVAKCSDVPDAFRSIESAYKGAGFSAPRYAAFKQQAHRIRLSQFLQKQKRRTADCSGP